MKALTMFSTSQVSTTKFLYHEVSPDREDPQESADKAKEQINNETSQALSSLANEIRNPIDFPQPVLVNGDLISPQPGEDLKSIESKQQEALIKEWEAKGAISKGPNDLGGVDFQLTDAKILPETADFPANCRFLYSTDKYDYTFYDNDRVNVYNPATDKNHNVAKRFVVKKSKES